MSYMADRTDWEWMENKAVEYADTFHIEKVCDSWNNLLKKRSVWYKMNRKKWDIVIKPRSGLFRLDLEEVWLYRDLLVMYIRRDIVTF